MGAAAESTLAVLSCLRCLSFLPRQEPTAARPLGAVDEDAEAGKGHRRSVFSSSRNIDLPMRQLNVSSAVDRCHCALCCCLSAEQDIEHTSTDVGTLKQQEHHEFFAYPSQQHLHRSFHHKHIKAADASLRDQIAGAGVQWRCRCWCRGA